MHAYLSFDKIFEETKFQLGGGVKRVFQGTGALLSHGKLSP